MSKSLGTYPFCSRQLLVITSKCESLGVPAPWPCPNLLWVVHSIVFEEHGAKVIVKVLKICPYPLKPLSPNAKQNWWVDEEVVGMWLPVLGHFKNGLCPPHSLLIFTLWGVLDTASQGFKPSWDMAIRVGVEIGTPCMQPARTLKTCEWVALGKQSLGMMTKSSWHFCFPLTF